MGSALYRILNIIRAYPERERTRAESHDFSFLLLLGNANRR